MSRATAIVVGLRSTLLLISSRHNEGEAMSTTDFSAPEFGNLQNTNKLGRELWMSEDDTVESQKMIGATILVILGIGIALGCYGANHWDPKTSSLSIVFGGVLAGGIAWFLLAKKQQLRHCEGGLQLDCDGRTTSIPWESLKSLKCEWTDNYNTGIYIGSVMLLKFSADNGEEITHKTSAHSKLEKQKYEGLKQLRECAGVVVAARMEEQLENTGQVDWVDGIVIKHDGLQWAGELGVITYPFEELVFKPENGAMQIKVAGALKASKRLVNSTENFEPGFLLCQSLRHGPPSQQQPEFAGTAR